MALPDAEALVAHLKQDGCTLAVAESCTGGMLGAAITDVPGASEVFLGGTIAYHNSAKVRRLAVAENVLATSGAVSAAAVESMAHGVRQGFGADVAIAVSGIAGPSGGTDDKPVGTVWVAVLGPEDLIHCHKLHLDGDRAAIRQAAVVEALRLAMGELEEATATA